MRLTSDAGSFRDPTSRVFIDNPSGSSGSKRIFRGVDAAARENYEALSEQAFFLELQQNRQIVSTNLLDDETAAKTGMLNGQWAGVLEHELIPFVSYPYEWTFSMLKDAALLHLSILETSLENGWTLKDATPYNIQFVGSQPIFIDIPSFIPRKAGEQWTGYRQFCAMFLTPLLIRAHLDIDHLPLLRSYLDGIPSIEALRYFHGTKKFKRGVLSHVVLPAKVEKSIAKKERDRAPAHRRKSIQQSDAMVLGLVQSMARLVRKLDIKIEHTDWSEYEMTHSYEDDDFETKKAFVQNSVSRVPRTYAWDIGCNTGTFSKLISEHSKHVISIDADRDSVEKLYRRESEATRSKILPLVMDLSNLSPNQGWAGVERAAFDRRDKPDIILCLALIHHVRLSANIPCVMFLEWLHSMNCEVVLEFVDRHDEMVVKLLTNKDEQYADYSLSQFVDEAEKFFDILDRAPLKGGKRMIFHLSPKAAQ